MRGTIFIQDLAKFAAALFAQPFVCLAEGTLPG